MKVPIKIIIYFSLVVLLLAGCNQPTQPTQSTSGEEVIVSLKNFDIHFERSGDFSETYMVFGGSDLSQEDMIEKISIYGIPMDKAISIYERYPDFHKCKSPGAAVAQNALVDLHIIPADSGVLNILKNMISQYEKNLKNDGNRVSVKLEGEVLKMTRGIMRKVNGDVTDQLPPQMRQDCYWVKSAEIIETKILFEDY